MNESCTIILPLPNRVLSPNVHAGSRGACMKKAAAAKKYRAQAKKATEAESITTGPWELATLQAVFFHKDKRKRDGVNFNAMLKAPQDGIVEAGLIVDDDAEHLTTLPPQFKIDKQFPRVEITVERQL